MVNYPQQYHAEAVASAELKESWDTTAFEKKLKCSIPKVYEGSGEAFSPEELFLLSMQNCFIASFKVYANHKHLEFDRLNVSADLIVDIENKRGPVMKSVEMYIEVFNVSDEKMATDLINRALEDGFIFNSINTSINPHISFNR